MNQFSHMFYEEDYKNRCRELKVEYVGFHKEKKKGTVIEYICPTHRDKGIQNTDWSHFRTQKRSCKYCYGREMTTEEFHSQILNPDDIVFLSEFLGTEKPLRCKCLKCGNEWTTNSPKDLRRRNGCPVCGLISKAKNHTKTQEQFENDLYKQNPNIRIIGKYQGSHKLNKCKCLLDGYEWESYGANLLNGSAGCPLCNNSIGENEIIDFLMKRNINFKTQFSFEDCRDIHVLKFDVFDIDNFILFEFQGEQHYFPIDFSGKGAENAQNEFEQLQRRDSIKKEYCKKNNILLICIPYTERGKVEQYILSHTDVYSKIKTA